MKTLFFVLLASPLAAAVAEPSPGKPNILFISIDDQNDWIGALGGHPLVKTPRIDQLASQGTTFLNAHCNAPICNPSRTSLMLGLRPGTTGIYGLAPWFRSVEKFKDRVTLPQHFKVNGYRTYTAGKIYHLSPGGPDKRKIEFDVWGPDVAIGASPAAKLVGTTPMGNHKQMDWGEFPHKDEDKGDYKVTSWVIQQLKEAPKDQPFFMAAGFFLPHVPCYATKQWFDLYPNDDSVLPEIQLDDRSDTPRFSWYLHWKLPEPRYSWLIENHQWRNLVRSYLASTSFVDAQVGRLLDALQETGLAKNTIIVLWSDQGWHLGEKGITGKNSLWEDVTRVPLIFAGPGVPRGQRDRQPAELLDIYPTLIDLSGIQPRTDLEGLSLVPQMNHPEKKRDRPAITTHNQGNHGIRSERWRFIQYADGSEELYDLKNDPNEWTNLAAAPSSQAILEEHRKWLPTIDEPPAPGSAHRILTYDKSTKKAVWEGAVIDDDDSIPN